MLATKIERKIKNVYVRKIQIVQSNTSNIRRKLSVSKQWWSPHLNSHHLISSCILLEINLNWCVTVLLSSVCSRLIWIFRFSFVILFSQLIFRNQNKHLNNKMVGERVISNEWESTREKEKEKEFSEHFSHSKSAKYKIPFKLLSTSFLSFRSFVYRLIFTNLFIQTISEPLSSSFQGQSN